MKQYRVLNGKSLSPGADLSAVRSTACPSDQDWARFAAALVAPLDADSMLDHAITCDACGRALRAATEEIGPRDLAPEAAHALSDEFRERMSAELQGQYERERTAAKPAKSRMSAKWVYAAAAIVLAVAAAWVVGRPDPDAEILLAQAYQSNRIWQSRFPGAAHVPLGATRSGAGGSIPLAEAQVAIGRRLEQDPDDSYWLRLHGRAELLSRRYDAAVEAIEPLAKDAPDGDPVQLDLGSALLERGLATGRAVDLEHSVELLSRFLSANPDDPIARFNRALAQQNLYLFEQAISDWSAYLQIDPDGGWADEAREHLRRLEEKKRLATGTEATGDAGGGIRPAPRYDRSARRSVLDAGADGMDSPKPGSPAR